MDSFCRAGPNDAAELSAAVLDASPPACRRTSAAGPLPRPFPCPGIAGRERPAMRLTRAGPVHQLLRPLAGSRRRIRVSADKELRRGQAPLAGWGPSAFCFSSEKRRPPSAKLCQAPPVPLVRQVPRLRLGACDGGSGDDGQARTPIALGDQGGTGPLSGPGVARVPRYRASS
jgi:hypothetical protein